jgi:predicted XRE-type DNA-binding protein
MNDNKLNFEQRIQDFEDPKNQQGVNYALPENPTSLQRFKYNLCQTILNYKLTNALSTAEIAERINLSQAETQDILHSKIEVFTLDRLVDYSSKILADHQQLQQSFVTQI